MVRGTNRIRNTVCVLVLVCLALLFPEPHRHLWASPEGGAESESAGTGTCSSAAAPVLCVNHLPVYSGPALVVEKDTVMMPVRVISEFLGLCLTWDDSSKTAVGVWNGQTIEFPHGKSLVKYSGDEYQIRSTISDGEGSLLVPPDVFERFFGCKVTVDRSSACVNVTLPPTPAEVWGFYALGSTEYSSWTDLFGEGYPAVAPGAPVDQFAGIIVGWFSVASDGTVSDAGNPSGFNRPAGWPAVLIQCRARQIPVYAMFYSNNAGEHLSSLLADLTLREKLCREIERYSREFQGVALDFEGLGASQESWEKDSANFNDFLTCLRSLLPAEKGLIVALPPINGHYQGYDHKFVGEIADRIILMAYGYEEPDKMGPTSPRPRVSEAMHLETDLVPPEKTLLGVPLYGTLYSGDGPEGVPTLRSKPALKDWESLVERSAGTPSWNPELGCWVLAWSENETDYTVFAEDTSTLVWRLPLVRKLGVAGIAFWRLGLAGPEKLNEVLEQVTALKPQSGCPDSP